MPAPGLPQAGLPGSGARPGASFSAKVSLGCGLLLLAFLVTCGSFTWLANRQAEAAADRGWAQLHAPFDRVRDEAGAAALFRESPGLQAKFGSEAAFLAAVASWRPGLRTLPGPRPRLRELLGRDGSSFRIRTEAVKGRPRTWIRYAPPGGASFTAEFEEGKVVDLEVR